MGADARASPTQGYSYSADSTAIAFELGTYAETHGSARGVE